MALKLNPEAKAAWLKDLRRQGRGYIGLATLNDNGASFEDIAKTAEEAL